MLNALKVRLRDILKVDLLAGAEVIAGEAGMNNEIASVNVMEVPDIVDWVRPGEHYGFLEEMGISRLFGTPEIRADLLGYADQVIQPIQQYDTEHDGKLLETVQAYFEHGGNLRKISEVQYTHYNTIVYRINRIRDTLKIDLKDPETAFSIQFALKIRDLIG